MDISKLFEKNVIKTVDTDLMFRGASGKLYKLRDTNLYRLFTLHADKGYVIVSACRSENDVETNNKNTNKLKQSIKESGFSYKMVQGGFVENAGTDNEKEVIETSFVVYNYKKDGTQDFDELYKLALKWCAEYNQDSVLVVAPNENPKYITANGSVDFELSKDVSIEHNINSFFTRLGNKRFYFKEIKDSEPKTMNGLYVREMSGEIMVDREGNRHYSNRNRYSRIFSSKADYNY